VHRDPSSARAADAVYLSTNDTNDTNALEDANDPRASHPFVWFVDDCPGGAGAPPDSIG